MRRSPLTFVGSYGQAMVPLMGHSLSGQAHALTMVITIAEPPAYLLWSLLHGVGVKRGPEQTTFQLWSYQRPPLLLSLMVDRPSLRR